jgi:CTP:molybdopterin cytidylyltransferase MocA
MSRLRPEWGKPKEARLDKTLHILILAAGRASRMRGADKLLEPVGGQPLLRRQVRLALATGLPTHLVLPPDRPLRRAAIAGLPVACVTAERAGEGMAESLKAGLAALPPGAPAMLFLADLPEIDANDLAAMVAAHKARPGAIIRATSAAGAHGHPVVFPAWLRAELLALEGDEGARRVLQRHAGQTQFLPLPDDHATTDLDTPEDWADWRRRREGPPPA